jgi:ribosome biogenesis GTPase / thiamine phosphate phosphatase
VVRGEGLSATRRWTGVREDGSVPTVALLGASGAGKSTLVNALAGRDVMETGAVREGDLKGRHTTTHRQLVPLPGGGVLIDTPGLRSVGLWDASAGLELAFPDIMELAAGCRFSDCAHNGEPDCAAAAAVVDGTLSAERLQAWRELNAEQAQLNERRLRAARARGRRRRR